jgi:hypothetical protein
MRLGDPESVIEYEDHAGWSPDARLLAANQMAHTASMEPRFRHLAAAILNGQPPYGESPYCRNIPKKAGLCFARWIRSSITYLQETPGVEILQGPVTTLATRVGDCDDNAILWATLMLSSGLVGRVVGVADRRVPNDYYHAVVYDEGAGRHYEVSCDLRYGGSGNRSEHFTTPPRSVTVTFDPMSGSRGVWRGRGYQYQEQPMLLGRPYTNPHSRAFRPDLPENPQSMGAMGKKVPGGPAQAATTSTAQDVAVVLEGVAPIVESVGRSLQTGGWQSAGQPPMINPGVGDVLDPLPPVDEMFFAQEETADYTPWIIMGGLVLVGGAAFYAFRDRG